MGAEAPTVSAEPLKNGRKIPIELLTKKPTIVEIV